MGRSEDARLPGPAVSPWRRTARYWIARLVAAMLTRGYLRLRLDGRDRLPPGPAIYCFNHLSWADPFVLMALLPFRPRLWFFGPKEEDMQVGGRNRVMYWTGTAIPYKPAKNDLLEATRRVGAVIDAGGVVAIAGEGRIHVRESELLPLSEGASYFALRSGVPIVPVAIRGTSWLRFGGRVGVTVGEPIAVSGRPTREALAELTATTCAALHELVADAPDVPVPGPVGRWVTERFNDWPEGSREKARKASEASEAAMRPASEGTGLPYSKPSD
jgi:1-acyl-sn-glycerol-3-phosphate acyltransferase